MFTYSLIYELNDFKNHKPNIKFNERYKPLNYSWYHALQYLYQQLLKILDKYFQKLDNVNDEEITDLSQKIINEIITCTEEYSDHYLDSSFVYKNILNNEHYQIFEKYKCFYPITNALENSMLINFDIFDLKEFLKDTIITKIVTLEKEVILSDIVPNKFLVVGLNKSSNLKEISKEIYKYRKECININCLNLFGNGNKLLVIYLFDNSKCKGE